MSNNWKPIDRVREYGNQTEKVETSEFPNEPIMNFENNSIKKPYYDETTCAYWCPSCMRATVLDMANPKLKRGRCPKCLQMIDWSGVK